MLNRALDSFEFEGVKAHLMDDGVLVVLDSSGVPVSSIPEPVLEYFFSDDKSKPDLTLLALQRAADILSIQQTKIQRRIFYRRKQQRHEKPGDAKVQGYVGPRDELY